MSDIAIESQSNEKSFHLNVEFFPQTFGLLGDKYRQARKAVALRQLEGKLAKIIAMSNGHRKNNVAKYSDTYQILLVKAEDAISEYCAAYSVPAGEIYAQMPAIKELRDWGSSAPIEAPAAVKVIGYISMTIIGIFVAGWAAGVIQRLFHFGWTIANYHMH